MMGGQVVTPGLRIFSYSPIDIDFCRGDVLPRYASNEISRINFSGIKTRITYTCGNW